MTITSRSACHPLLALLALLALAGCGSDDDTGACTPIAAGAFPCADASQCLSVTATWCYPGATTCANTNVDLSLTRPDSIVVGVKSGQSMSANGCALDGDERANALSGPFDENITCSPYLHAQPPDRIDPGTYVVGVADSVSGNLSTRFVRLDINVNGQTSCQIVDVSAGPVQVGVTYP